MKLGKQRTPRALGSITRTSCVSLAALGLLASCGGQAEDGFGVETYDEYAQPLTNSIIGTPDGVVVTTGPDGSVVVGGGRPVTGSAGSGSFDDDDVIISPGGSGGSGGRAGAGGGSAGGSSPADESGFGFWHLDDCLPSSHFLLDSSGLGAHARHELGAECVPGISEQGVRIESRRDLIQVPDEPQFTLNSRVAVAAWVKPNTVRGDQPIVLKRLNDQTSFSLGIHNGNIEMAVVLSNGTTVIS
ncbi:MAG TPA: hypothetical protein VJU61_24910, partial [Polyangiaceae bacterium]|nr:hypothetical protein [Polyangiaceae bacterium]